MYSRQGEIASGKVPFDFLASHSMLVNSLTTKEQRTKFSSANCQKNHKSKLYHIENSKTRGQTV